MPVTHRSTDRYEQFAGDQMSFNSDQVQVQFPERKRVFTSARARGAQYDVLVSIVVSIPVSMPIFFCFRQS